MPSRYRCFHRVQDLALGRPGNIRGSCGCLRTDSGSRRIFNARCDACRRCCPRLDVDNRRMCQPDTLGAQILGFASDITGGGVPPQLTPNVPLY